MINLSKIKSKKPIVVAIDGVAGSGKTTLAMQLLSDLADAQVAHLDDFYDGWENPLSAKLTSRVISQLLNPFSNQLQVNYQSFNWKLNRFDIRKQINQSKYLILEGVGSSQREFRTYLSKIIWLECDSQVGFERVITRDGETVREAMVKFLLDQNNHFAAELSKNAADYTLNGAP